MKTPYLSSARRMEIVKGLISVTSLVKAVMETLHPVSWDEDPRALATPCQPKGGSERNRIAL